MTQLSSKHNYCKSYSFSVAWEEKEIKANLWRIGKMSSHFISGSTDTYLCFKKMYSWLETYSVLCNIIFPLLT